MVETTVPLSCLACGTQIAAGLLACPVCRKLIHGPQLTALAQEAEQAQAAGDISKALARWRDVLELLPPDTKQYQAVRDRIGPLSSKVGAADTRYEQQKIERHPFFQR